MFQSLCCLMSAFGLFCGNKIPRWLHNDKEHNNVYIYTHDYTYLYTYYIYIYIYIISFIFNIYIYVHRHLDKMNLYVLTRFTMKSTGGSSSLIQVHQSQALLQLSNILHLKASRISEPRPCVSVWVPGCHGATGR
jgi:hypothetical protein